MPEVVHHSIGQKVKVTEDAAEAKDERKKKIIDRITAMPWNPYGIDQWTIWVLWATAAVSFFLFCTVSAVELAVR